eukprot:11222101-Lingulodinium_polyedra.AAC.1
MGWVEAVSLFQHLHCRPGFEEAPQGANHDVTLERARSRPWPLRSGTPRQAWAQFYLDDSEIVPDAEVPALAGT